MAYTNRYSQPFESNFHWLLQQFCRKNNSSVWSWGFNPDEVLRINKITSKEASLYPIQPMAY